MRNVLVICGHPRGAASFSHALARACADGARQAGCSTTLIDIASLDFNPDVITTSPRQQPLEPDLECARAAIAGADHLVFVYPTWWGVYPARLKGFLDRVLLPGWAFEECDGGTGYIGLLQGKTADIVTTMDTPAPIYNLVLGAPGHKAMARATLGFCGVDVVRIVRFGVARTADDAQRKRWLEEAHALGARVGARLDGSPHTPMQRAWRALRPWLAALRLQFYPMTLLAYALGAFAATQARALDRAAFWLGFLVLFLLEAATVFSNDLNDEQTDRLNRLWGPFNGGSRMLVSGALSRRALHIAVRLFSALALLVATIVCVRAPSPAPAAAIFATMAVLALGYTAAPLKFCYRGLGELDVALTHSIGVVLLGFVLQGGAAFDITPWALSLPLGLSVAPAIILSGVPDHDSDAAAGKGTLAVRLGVRGAIRLSMALAALAALSSAVLLGAGFAALAGLPIVAALHGAWLIGVLAREQARPATARRIDGVMALALSYVVWFGAIPFLNLL